MCIKSCTLKVRKLNRGSWVRIPHRKLLYGGRNHNNVTGKLGRRESRMKLSQKTYQLSIIYLGYFLFKIIFFKNKFDFLVR